MKRHLSAVCCSSASLPASEGATHCTECPNRCNRMKHCISKSTSGSMTSRRPSKMPVRGGSRSRYSITKPYFTIREAHLIHSSTKGGLGIRPTRRLPTSSGPEIFIVVAVQVLAISTRPQGHTTHRGRQLRATGFDNRYVSELEQLTGAD